MPMTLNNENYYLHNVIIENRDELVRAEARPLKNKVVERLFDHATSVFKEWKPDSPFVISKVLEHDFGYWKAANFCKDPEELERVKVVMRQNIDAVLK